MFLFQATFKLKETEYEAPPVFKPATRLIWAKGAPEAEQKLRFEVERFIPHDSSIRVVDLAMERAIL